MPEPILQVLKHFLGSARLSNEAIDLPHADGFGNVIKARGPCKEHRHDIWVPVPDFEEQFGPIEVGHAKIGNHHGKGTLLFEGLNGFLG